MTTHGLTCKIIEKKGKRAKIEIEGQIIEVPIEIIPERTDEGAGIELFLLNAEQASLQEKKLAKYILEEILNGK